VAEPGERVFYRRGHLLLIVLLPDDPIRDCRQCRRHRLPNPRPARFPRSRGETRTGLFVLVDLACKSAILMVEFAREIERRGRRTSCSPLEALRQPL
jgi:hypothetical protein